MSSLARSLISSNFKASILRQMAGNKISLFKEIVESQRAFLKKAREWTKISDYAYIKTNEEK